VEVRTGLADVRGALRSEVAGLRGEFREALEAQTVKLLKWMLGIWVATVPTVAGVVVLVEHFLPAVRP
jgi:hypothetical protein